MKLHLYISNPEEFTKGEYDWCFSVRCDKDWTDKYQPNWIYVRELVLNVEKYINPDSVLKAAVQELEDCISATLATAEVKAQGYRDRKQQLLALEAPHAI